ncbi:MAG: two-component system chemotaxis sensor kinase CheA [Flavobacteriales bacterium]|jgi:two-component system chemotaxis sensor kinase CheA
MAFGEDEEILQDFLVEAGEIIETLSEELVKLEQAPDDKELLNSIFRGFHTVKGGAGFLQLTAMVDCCHVTENLFDILRNGDRSVTAELMDVVLQALDTVNQQFAQIQNGDAPAPALPELIRNLEKLVAGEDISVYETTAAEASTVGSDSNQTGKIDLSDEEFEGFLDAIGGEAPVATTGGTVSSSDEISEDEFENLLDQLHGSGNAPSTGANTAEKSSTNTPPKAAASSRASSDEISEDEFENLLDQLHGSGKAPSIKSAAPSDTASAGARDKSGSLISDDEFEDLLDQLHGKGMGPTHDVVASPKSAVTPKSNPPVSAPKTTPVAKAAPKPEKSSIAPDSKAPVVKKEGAQNAAAQGETTVRVDTQRLDDIMNMVGELVLVRNRLVRLGSESADEAMQKAVANLDVVTADLQTAVMKTRMQPIKKVFGRFPRVVRDLARNLKKEINLELKGEETDLDKNLVEALADPLVHLVRNSVDHGIELPSVRESSGKSRVGKVILAAEQEGDHILLSITDDGAGMDPDTLRDKAVEKGIMDQDAVARLSDVDAFNLIFAPGFSTKTEISDVSGRGVGMDVVKTKITQLNGSIEIASKLGEGTRIVIKVPLTLAIMPTLMIMVGRQTFALPLVSVNEIFHMDLTRISVVDSQECIVIREKTIPVFYLKHWLVKGGGSATNPESGHVVIVSVGTQRVGFVVDQLIGQEEVVIKPLGKLLHGTPGMAGATITGDGTIALILDVPSMLKRYA